MPDLKELVLATLASSPEGEYSPVQVQKLFFLIDRNVAHLLGGPLFDFQPYNYGPFDPAVYKVLEALASEGAIQLIPDRTWKNYALTALGRQRGEAVLRNQPEKVRDYFSRVSEFVRKLTFTQLVSAIYKAYPEMRANSVFQN
jgi:uncharacterized protein